jgi:CheY-like chemotaxis protein
MASPPSPKAQPQILVVDDEPDMLGLLGALLKGSLPEANVVLLESPFRALEHLATHAVDLIITDYRMPGLGGLDLAKEARTRKPDMPIILMTGFADDNLRTEAFVLRINVLLKKPVDPPEFISEIRRLLAPVQSH